MDLYEKLCFALSSWSNLKSRKTYLLMDDQKDVVTVM